MKCMQVGVAALHQMSVVLASNGGAELDAEGWQGLTDMLGGACGMDCVTAVPLQQRRETVVMAQRSVSQILSHCGRCMPPSFHLQLLHIVQESVLRAAAANREAWEQSQASLESQPATPAADQLEPHTHDRQEQSYEGVALQPEDPVQPAAAMQDADGKGSMKDSMSSPLADAQVQIEPAVSAQISAENGVENRHDGLLDHGDATHGVASGVDDAALTWLDQQNEGGKLLVKSYLLTIDLFKQSAARSSTLVEAAECAAEAEKRLAALCTKIVAAVCTHGNENGKQPQNAADWSTRYNAPVVCALLRGVRKRGGDEEWAKVVMPHLPLLIRSGDASVRTAVASVYEHVVGPKLMART